MSVGEVEGDLVLGAFDGLRGAGTREANKTRGDARQGGGWLRGEDLPPSALPVGRVGGLGSNERLIHLRPTYQ